MVRVILAEDSYLIREGVARVLESADDMELVASVPDATALDGALGQYRPDVVVMDIRMPPGFTDEGIAAANLLRDTHPQIGVVVLSQFDEPEFAIKLLERGSARRAYVLKDRLSDPAALLTAIREVARGGSMIDAVVVERLVATRTRFESSALATLSPRELDVLSSMAQGYTNEAIAQRLFLSTGVVEKHSNAIFSKLGLGEEPDVNRRVKAVLIYLAEDQSPR